VLFSFEEDVMGEGLKGVPSHPEDRMQEVKQVIVGQKGEEGEEQDALDEVTECPVMYGDVVRAVVKVTLKTFLFIRIFLFIHS
jgi:hypothetical protein